MLLARNNHCGIAMIFTASRTRRKNGEAGNTRNVGQLRTSVAALPLMNCWQDLVRKELGSPSWTPFELWFLRPLFSNFEQTYMAHAFGPQRSDISECAAALPTQKAEKKTLTSCRAAQRRMRYTRDRPYPGSFGDTCP